MSLNIFASDWKKCNVLESYCSALSPDLTHKVLIEQKEVNKRTNLKITIQDLVNDRQYTRYIYDFNSYSSNNYSKTVYFAENNIIRIGYDERRPNFYTFKSFKIDVNYNVEYIPIQTLSHYANFSHYTKNYMLAGYGSGAIRGEEIYAIHRKTGKSTQILFIPQTINDDWLGNKVDIEVLEDDKLLLTSHYCRLERLIYKTYDGKSRKNEYLDSVDCSKKLHKRKYVFDLKTNI